MRIVLVMIALVAAVAVAHADTFSWSEDFQGSTLADYWQLHADENSFVGVVDDPADPGSGNKCLMVDTWDSGGLAYANVLMDAFHGMDAAQETTASFRFFLADPDNCGFTIMGSNSFTGLVDVGDWYGANNGDEDTIELPVGEWVNFKYVFTPQSGVGSSHKLYINDQFMGEFANGPSFLDENVAFFVGDNEDAGVFYGNGYWDDFQITGTALPAPEPASLLSMIGGASGMGLLAIRRRKRARS